MTVGSWLPRMLFWTIILSATLTRAQPPPDATPIPPQQLNASFVDTTTCYSGLAEADTNGDDRIELDEYLSFVKSIGPQGFLADIDSIVEAPLILQANFRTLSCRCRLNGGDSQCCVGDNAHIPITGVNDGETPDTNQTSFLFLVCSLTSRAIDQEIALAPTMAPSSPAPFSPSAFPSQSPTPFPTKAPSPAPTPLPTNGPSSGPTSATTPAPTPLPTNRPSPAPTPAPAPLPTSKPTSAPTPGPTPGPTPAPSARPSGLPSDSPTRSPSIVPTKTPSKAPTRAPSSTPSRRPTSKPSPVPSTSPTISPAPSSRPSNSAEPTATPQPTPSPSSSPTTTSPSSSPTLAPTAEGIGVVARTIYTVAVVNGITENIPASSYVPDLIASMNVVAVEVAVEVDFGSTDGSRRHFGSSDGRRRRLEVRVSLPTFIDGVVDADGLTDTPEFVDGLSELGACPSDLASPNDRCEQVTASVGLFLDEEAPQIVRQLYEAALDRAIGQGRLQDALTEINPNSPVRILTSNGVNGSRSTESESLSAGATAGIVIGAFAAVGLLGAIFISRRREEKPADVLQPVSSTIIPSGVEFELDSSAEEELDSPDKHRIDEEAGTVQSGEAVLGATKPEYGGNHDGKSQSSSSMDGWSNAGGNQDYIQALNEENQGQGARSRTSSASSAGHSGWSSNYTSSIDSGGGSPDEIDNTSPGTLMVDLGAGSGIAAIDFSSEIGNRTEIDFSSEIGNRTEIDFSSEIGSRTELDNAIVAGDWAAVGATAAVLAANASGHSDSESSLSSRPSSTRTGDSSQKSAKEMQKAAELDRLIEVGDWEGVITAALKFESDGKSLDGSHPDSRGSASGAESSHQSSHFSSTSSSAGGSVSISGSTTGSGITPHTFPSSSQCSGTGPSKRRDRAEVRKEVEDLVQRVVPEETEHVDEMMLQFEGREDELLETLRTMEERQVAHKARTTTNKQVKLEAKQAVRERRQAAEKVVLSRQEEKKKEEEAKNKHPSRKVAPPSSPPRSLSPSPTKKATPDASVYSPDEAVNSPEEGGHSINLSPASFDIASALKYSGTSPKASKTSAASPNNEGDGKEALRQHQLKEEKTALAQAKMWSKIAEKSKPEEAEEGSAASQAADWAIAQSLSKMEQKDRASDASDPDQADKEGQESV